MRRRLRVYFVGGGTAVDAGWRESITRAAVREAVEAFLGSVGPA